MVAASKPLAAELAGRLGDGFIGTAPEAEIVEKFESAGGARKPKFGQVACCWAETAEEGRKTAYEIWPNAGLKGDLAQELALPSHFEQASQLVTEEEIAEATPHGPDPGPVIEQIEKYADAGYTHVYIHQIGRDQEGFFRFAEREILPRFQ